MKRKNSLTIQKNEITGPVLFTKQVLVLFSFWICSCFNSGSVMAQDSLLTLDKAIENSLLNNFDVKIAGIERDQNKNNDHAGMAGMLPKLDLNGSYSTSNQNTRQSYSSGLEVNRDNVSTDNLNANASAVWTVFDGLKMFATREKLGELYYQSEEKLKVQMESTLQEVISTYYSIVQQKQLLASTREEIKYAEERMHIAERRLGNGSGSRLDFLQTKTDLNALRSAELNQQSALEAAKIQLNQFMNKDLSSSFDVTDTIIINYSPSLEDLRNTVLSKNHTLKYFERNQQISKLGLKELQGSRLPKISLNGAYQFTKVKNEVGFILLNQNTGLNYGITASLPLFNGFILSSQIKNARLNLKSSQLLVEQSRQEISAELLNAYRNFTNQKATLKLEEENIEYAREILKVAQEKFRIGASSLVEVKNAQSTFEAANLRLVSARYNTKVSETLLRRLNGDLIH